MLDSSLYYGLDSDIQTKGKLMWSKWYCLNDKSNARGYVVKRYKKKDGKTLWESLPAKNYGHLSRADCEALVRRMNVSHDIEIERARKRYDFDHAYINVKVMERFEEFLHSSADDEQHIKRMLGYISDYTFEYFVLHRKLPDPRHWKSVEDQWGLWLTDNQKLAHSTVKQIIQNANRFLRFLSEKAYPGEVPLVILQPLSRRKLSNLKHRTSEERFKYITPERFAEIVKSAPADVNSAIDLCYRFGLRISESLGCQLGDVRKGYLSVERQASKCSFGKLTYKQLKDNDHRQVPYWYATQAEAYALIETLTPMHKDTLVRKTNQHLSKFGHESHDLRRSFVTRALRDHHWKDVRLAVGHEDIETTLKYDQDDRVMTADERWVP